LRQNYTFLVLSHFNSHKAVEIIKILESEILLEVTGNAAIASWELPVTIISST
jgi:hypothetical protein